MVELMKVPNSILVKDNDLQITLVQKEELEKQQYRMVGHHSAVKICGWTKNHLVGKGVCYKYSFYGIRSHQCLQMTTSMYCASRCLFCWRGAKAPVATEWYGPVDKPSEIIDNAIDQQMALLQGFNGNEKAIPELVKEMKTVKHVALSLTGEPITYPLMNELLNEFHKRRISTFLVSNAQYPEELEKLDNVTQLYLSIDAPNMDAFKKIDRPLYTDYEERILKSLDVLSTRKYRTAIRLTAIKDLNMDDIEGYCGLIKRGNPDFIEVKAYMHVGASKEVLDYSNMPLSDEVEDFATRLESALDNYTIIDKHDASRVVLLARNDMKDLEFIDFGRFFDIVNAGGKAEAKEYSAGQMCSNE